MATRMEDSGERATLPLLSSAFMTTAMNQRETSAGIRLTSHWAVKLPTKKSP